MPEKPEEKPSPMVVASQWATRVITVAIEMVLPGFLGLWIDRYLGTKAVFLLAGLAGGVALALWQLVRMTRSTDKYSDHPHQHKDRSGEHQSGGKEKRGRGGS